MMNPDAASLWRAPRWALAILLAVLGMAVLAGLIWWPIDPGRALMVAVAVLVFGMGEWL